MLTMGKVPTDFYLEEDRLLNEFVMISGVSELMKLSETPDNVTSGVALSILAEQDETRLNITAASIRNAVKEVGRQLLRLYKQFAAVKRIKRIAGEGGDVEQLYFNASDITSDDLVFDSENDMLDSPSGRKNMVMELLKTGVMTEEDGRLSKRTKLKVLEALGLGNWETMKDMDELHRKKAARENLSMCLKDVMPDEIDDHELHIGEHTRFIVSGEDEDKAVKEKIIKHIRLHKQFMSLIDNSALRADKKEDN
jgi:hypothetical protein